MNRPFFYWLKGVSYDKAPIGSAHRNREFRNQRNSKKSLQ
ncbi:hypothetical protein HMPREF3226_00710 [Prevotella corporis]|uniref:Uncharacterized protein n=1 Tax=Prevotella corporis TaxID=28128 RepID=A0A133QHS9_9BACT|nr:hypothetical protein HMPREF3226_00710 [Prevotella corporis]